MRKCVRHRRGTAIENLEGRVLLSGTVHSIANTIYHTTYQMIRSGATLAPDNSGPITPVQMAQAYGVNNIKFGSVTGDGTGQTIAIIDAYDDPNAAADLHAFDQQFSLPDAPSFTRLNQTGGTTLPGTDPSPKGNDWEIEESLDIEWAHAIAPNASIILYEANSASDADLIQAAAVTAKNNASVTAISMSFGGGESSGETSDDAIFTSTHATFFASTGDGGAPSASYPAFSPNVVAVGGTSLNIGSSGSYISETGWSGSGGGKSQVEPEPSYQQSVQSTGARTIPDVSMDADPNTGVWVYDSYDFPTNPLEASFGGTSLSSPMWAGLMAIADQGRVLNGLSPLGSSQTLPLLYQSATNNYHDVTSGSNNGFSAGVGYDEVTGIGTPKANLLVPFLAGTKPTVNSFSGSPNPVTAGSNETLTANVTDPDAAVTTVAFYRETNGTSGLQTGSGGDTFLGNGTANGSGGWTLTTATTGLSGNVTYYVLPTDASGVTGTAASTSVTVTTGVTPPTLTGAPVINGDDPNGLYTASGQPANGAQRSMVEDIVYTFNEAIVVNDANAAFTVKVAGPAGGTVPSTLSASAVPGSNGTKWAVSLTGQPLGTLASIANGEYSIQINPSFVFAAADGTTTLSAGRTDTFYRLFGDAQGTESVNTLDYARFKQALSTYNPIFDVDGNGSVSTLDYARFKQDLSVSYSGDGFVTSI